MDVVNFDSEEFMTGFVMKEKEGNERELINHKFPLRESETQSLS